MNILLWILQILLAFWNLTGGLYTFTHYERLKAPAMSELPQAFWMAISVLQILFALGLILPGLFGASQKITPVSAGYLGLNALAGCVLFAKYSGFPGVLWGLIPALLCAVVVYGRSR